VCECSVSGLLLPIISPYDGPGGQLHPILFSEDIPADISPGDCPSSAGADGAGGAMGVEQVPATERVWGKGHFRPAQEVARGIRPVQTVHGDLRVWQALGTAIPSLSHWTLYGGAAAAAAATAANVCL